MESATDTEGPHRSPEEYSRTLEDLTCLSGGKTRGLVHKLLRVVRDHVPMVLLLLGRPVLRPRRVRGDAREAAPKWLPTLVDDVTADVDDVTAEGEAPAGHPYISKVANAAKRQDVAQWIRNKVSEMVTFQGASRERNMRCRGDQNWPKAPEDDSNRPSSDQLFANDDVRPEMVDRRVDSTEKARRVALGYEDPDLGTNENSATTIRHDSQSRQMIHCCLRGYRLRNRAAPTTLLAGRACRQTRKVDMLQPEEIVKYLVKRYGDKARGPQDRALQLCDARPLTSLERLALEDPLIHCDIGQIAAREIELCPGACVWRGRACTFRCDLYWGHRMDSDVLTYVCVIIASKKMPG